MNPSPNSRVVAILALLLVSAGCMVVCAGGSRARLVSLERRAAEVVGDWSFRRRSAAAAGPRFLFDRRDSPEVPGGILVPVLPHQLRAGYAHHRSESLRAPEYGQPQGSVPRLSHYRGGVRPRRGPPRGLGPPRFADWCR